MTDIKKELDIRKEQLPLEAESTRNRRVFIPRVDIKELYDALELIADMPGVDENHIDITLEKNVLTLMGTIEPERYEGYHVSYAEYDVGDYKRSFTLTDEIDRDRIAANIKNGVLRVRLPRAESTKPKKITVTVSE